MSQFGLRNYQTGCIDAVVKFLERGREVERFDSAYWEATKRDYQQVGGLEGLPYVCLRVPTGGGKTAIAAYMVKPVIEHLLQREVAPVLWLAPTGKIVQQTIDALKDPKHPYRQELDRAFDGRVTILSLQDSLYVQQPALQETCTIVVSTFQSLRIDDTEGRKVYRQNGALQNHFTNLSVAQRDALLTDAAGTSAGDVDHPLTESLCNVLKMHRPIVLMDEAHNARTTLSFETLKRFAPSGIFELTATPADDSNVLHSVSAAELKDAEMIKLPVVLRTRDNGRDAIGQAVQKRDQLAHVAEQEQKTGGGYVRPIVLYQAESKGGDLTPEAVKKILVSELEIDEARIAICTGKTDELPDIPMQSADNPIEHVITVQKLREGWDCPFAYVLCSVANLSAKTAVEQLLGRILRMPYAKRRVAEELNQAYCYATSSDFQTAAKSLEDAIVESGFSRYEAKRVIAKGGEDDDAGLFGDSFDIFEQDVTAPVNVTELPESVRPHIEVSQGRDGVKLHWSGGPMSDKAAGDLAAAFTSEKDQKAVERLKLQSRGLDASPAAVGEQLKVPVLHVKANDGQRLLLDDQPLEDADLDLVKCNHELSESEFRIKAADDRIARLDVNDKGKVQTEFLQDLDERLLLFDTEGPRTPANLATWLDRQIVDQMIMPAQKRSYLLRVVEHLLSKRGFTIEQLSRHRQTLKEAAAHKIYAFKVHAESEAYQHLLDNAVAVDMDICMRFPASYPASALYEGKHKFTKHFYQDVAAMNGEELEVAKFIDSQPAAECWVRNLEKSDRAFHLRLPHGRFFPDFVVQLVGEKFIVIEHKGVLDGLETEQNKRRIGEMWAAQQPDELAFCWTSKQNYQQVISDAIKRLAG